MRRTTGADPPVHEARDGANQLGNGVRDGVLTIHEARDGGLTIHGGAMGV